MKLLSDKRAAIERRMKITYSEIEQDRGAFCEESGATNFEHSHNYPRNPFIWLIPVAQNITLLSREKHLDFENNELWKLPNSGPKIMRQMMALMLAETDVDRRKLMRSHYVRKLYAMKEQAETQDVELPGWCKTLLNEIGI
jgi:hypothetical protein